MIDDNKFKVKTVEINDGGTYGKFVCEPLDRGYGITLGNSLRRVLLASLDGVAITSIKSMVFSMNFRHPRRSGRCFGNHPQPQTGSDEIPGR